MTESIKGTDIPDISDILYKTDPRHLPVCGVCHGERSSVSVLSRAIEKRSPPAFTHFPVHLGICKTRSHEPVIGIIVASKSSL